MTGGAAPRPAFDRPGAPRAGRTLHLVLSCRDLRVGAGGGLARATADLAVALAARGHTVRVLTDASRAELVRLPGVHIAQLTVRRGSGRFADPPPDSAEHNLAYAAAMYREVRRIHRQQTPVDAVLAPLWRSEGAVCLLDDRFPTAVSCMTSLRTLTEIDPEYNRDPSRLALERASLVRSPYLHGLTAEVLRQTIADFDLRPRRSVVIPRGLRDRAPHPMPLSSADPLEVLFVGRLEARKGVDVLLRAAAQLARSAEPIRFTLAGPRDGGATERLLDELGEDEPRLRDMVTMLGALPDDRLDELLQDAGAICLPSRYESHGIAVLEAFMFARPLVTTTAGGLADVVADGRTALTIPSDDPGALAAALRRLARDPALRERLGSAGREAFEAGFEVAGVAERMAGFLGDLPANPDGREASAGALEELLDDSLGGAGERGLAEELLADDDPLAAATRRRLVRGAVASIGRAEPEGRARTTAVILTRDRPHELRRALDSLDGAGAPVDVLVLDDGSEPSAARAVRELCAERRGVRLERLETSIGCAAGRMAATARTSAELLLFLDDDAELLPGALAHLLDELDAHPDAGAVSASVCLPDGHVAHSGGHLRTDGRTAWFSLIGEGLPWTPDALPPTGPADWLGWTAVLVRRSLLEAFPLDPQMRAYFEDNEWGYRVGRELPDALRRSREALALHHMGLRHPLSSTPPDRRQAVELLSAAGHFLRRHGLLLAPGVFTTVPELGGDVKAARMLLELVNGMGAEWVLEAWLGGGLEGLLDGRALRRRTYELAERIAQLEAARAEHVRRLEAAMAELQTRHEHLCDANADLHRDHAVVLDRERGLLAAVEAQDVALAALARRDETLARIEQGGWWRLRGRLLPLLRILAALRRRPAGAR